MVIDCIYEKVVGVSFNNDDGSSRQHYIRRLHEDDMLLFESFDYNGETAFHVMTTDGHCIGNLSKDIVPRRPRSL